MRGTSGTMTSAAGEPSRATRTRFRIRSDSGESIPGRALRYARRSTPMSAHPELVEHLLDPSNYPPPRPSRVEFRSTHLSWVFLTDGEAWKVKRPVDYGFAD